MSIFNPVPAAKAKKPRRRSTDSMAERIQSLFPGKTQPTNVSGLAGPGRDVTIGSLPIGQYGAAIDTSALKYQPGKSLVQTLAEAVRDSPALAAAKQNVTTSLHTGPSKQPAAGDVGVAEAQSRMALRRKRAKVGGY